MPKCNRVPDLSHLALNSHTCGQSLTFVVFLRMPVCQKLGQICRKYANKCTSFQDDLTRDSVICLGFVPFVAKVALE